MGATKPPVRKPITEAEIEAVINKGGRTIRESKEEISDKPKHINIRLTNDIITGINLSRDKRPRKPGSPKAGISLHDWIVEAVLEKLEREG